MSFNLATDYERQHNLAVDMCAECILHYRKLLRPLKAIYLRPRYFSLFRHWVSEKFGVEAAMTSAYQFDGVNIEEGSNLQQQSLSVEFWPDQVPAEA